MRTTEQSSVPMDNKQMDDFENKRMMFIFPFKVNRLIRQYLSEPCEKLGLKEYQAPVLNIIYYYDGISQKGITAMLPFDKSRISVVVNELISAGVVKNSGKGRTSSLHLTDRGKEVVLELSAHVDELYDKVCSPLSEEEKKQADEMQLRICRNIDLLLENIGGDFEDHYDNSKSA